MNSHNIYYKSFKPSFFSKRTIFFISVILFLLISASYFYKAFSPNTYVYYMSTSGDDINPGTKSLPLKSVDGFKKVLLKDLSNKVISDNSHVKLLVSSGTYYFTDSFSLTNKDLQNKNISLSILGNNSNDVIFTGGYNLNSKNFNNKLFSKIYTYDLSQINLPTTDDIKNNKTNLSFPFCEVIFDDTPLTLSRYPNIVSDKTENNTKPKDNTNISVNKNNKSDISFLLTGKVNSNEGNYYNFNIDNNDIFKWKDTSNLYMSGYFFHDWSSSIVKVSNLDKTNNAVSFSDSLPYGLKENQRFYFFNSLDALDAKGEYYIDYSKKLLYLIPPSYIKSKDIYINLLKSPIINVSECSNLTIKNITFQGSQDNLIVLNNATNVTIDNCIFKNSTKNGIVFNNAKDSVVSNSHFYNIGEGGIILTGGNREALEAANCKITNNKFNNFSRIKRTYTPAINISGVGITASNNTIFDSPHTGILFGGNDIIIEKNNIYNICKETNDVGAIYTGRDWTYRGNIIRYNNIHDLGKNSPGNWVVGVYLDDCMSSANVYKNKITNVPLGILAGGGRDITIEDNQITNCENSIIFDERGLTWANLSELEKRLLKVPYNSKKWIKKYPEIKSLDKIDHSIPYNNTIKDNNLKNSGEIKLSDSVKKYEKTP